MKSAEIRRNDSYLDIPAWQRQILDERLADLEQNPDAEQTWEEVKADLCPFLQA